MLLALTVLTGGCLDAADCGHLGEACACVWAGHGMRIGQAPGCGLWNSESDRHSLIGLEHCASPGWKTGRFCDSHPRCCGAARMLHCPPASLRRSMVEGHTIGGAMVDPSTIDGPKSFKGILDPSEIV